MQKKIIALAIAGLSSAAFAQSNVTIYGAMRVSVDHVNSATTNSDKWQVEDRASRIGFKGTEDLGNGLKAVWQWESMLNSTGVTATNTAANSQRNTFLGLAGNFGTALVGTHDTPYKLGGSADIFADTAADSQANTTGIIGRNGFDNRLSNVVAYISPTWSGFHFAVAGSAGEQTGQTTSANGLTDALSMVAVYANGPLKVTLAQETRSANFVAAAAAKTTEEKAKGTKFNVGYTMGAIGLGYTYETSTDVASATVGRVKDKAHLMSATYAMGATTLGLQYGKFNDKGTNSANGDVTASDLKRVTIGAYHNLSKRTQAYAAWNKDSYGAGVTSATAIASNDAKTLTMGLNHSF